MESLESTPEVEQALQESRDNAAQRASAATAPEAAVDASRDELDQAAADEEASRADREPDGLELPSADPEVLEPTPEVEQAPQEARDAAAQRASDTPEPELAVEPTRDESDQVGTHADDKAPLADEPRDEGQLQPDGDSAPDDAELTGSEGGAVDDAARLEGRDAEDPSNASGDADGPAPDGPDAEGSSERRGGQTAADDLQTVHLGPDEVRPPDGDTTQTSKADGTRPLVDRVPTDNPKIEKAWETSSPIDAGRAYLPTSGPDYRAAQDLEPTIGQYTAVIHGNPQETAVKTGDGEFTRLSPNELGDIIESDPAWQGQDVRLFACETGKTPADGGPPYGQQLADRLGVDVSAPDQLAWASEGATGEEAKGWSSTAREEVNPMTGERMLVPDSDAQSPNGNFIRFRPREAT